MLYFTGDTHGRFERVDEHSGLLLAKDGKIFNLNGKQTVVIGGVYSIDMS